MITKFKIFEQFENINFNINLPEDLKNLLVDGLSLLIYKGKKRNGQNNYKSLRIQSVDGYINNDKLKLDKLNNEVYLKIQMTNMDIIEGKYLREYNLDNVTENSITISINNDETFSMDLDSFTEKDLINKIIITYKKYLKKWKIK